MNNPLWLNALFSGPIVVTAPPSQPIEEHSISLSSLGSSLNSLAPGGNSLACYRQGGGPNL